MARRNRARDGLRRRPLARAAILAVVLAMTATTAGSLHRSTAVAQEQPPDAEELSSELEHVTRKLEQARTGRQVVESQVTDAQALLARADHRLAELTDELAKREAQLATATAAYEAAAARTAEAQRELEQVTARLEESKAELARDEARFGNRVAAAYMYGGSLQMVEAILTSQTISQMVQTGYYVESVLDEDQELVHRVAQETREIAQERRRADILRDRLATEQAAAERARRDVEQATEVQRELTERVAQQRAEREQLLLRLQSDLASYTQLVAAYEAESARLAEELADARWQALAPGPGGLLWPTDGHVGSGFGYRTHPIFGTRRLHSGVDIAGGYGQPIMAAAAGQVVSAGWRGGYGRAVVIDHGGGLATLYAHQSHLVVTEGQVVEAGQQIGQIGSTGQSTGPHLHFEVRVNGVPHDPMDWY